MIGSVEFWKLWMKRAGIKDWSALNDTCLVSIPHDNEDGFVIVKANDYGVEWEE